VITEAGKLFFEILMSVILVKDFVMCSLLKKKIYCYVGVNYNAPGIMVIWVARYVVW
jgi:hypothetical protein